MEIRRHLISENPQCRSRCKTNRETGRAKPLHPPGSLAPPTPEERRPSAESPQPTKHKSTLITRWADLEWCQQWETKARNRREATWRIPWTTPTLPLYDSLSKAEATALFLL